MPCSIVWSVEHLTKQIPRSQVGIPAQPYNFHGDWSWIHFYGHSPIQLVQEGQLSFTDESMSTNINRFFGRSLPKKSVSRLTDWLDMTLTVLTALGVEWGGGGGGGGGEVTGVIVVRVFEPVFRNLPQSCTWPLKKRTHSYTSLSEMLTHSYTALWFLYPFIAGR